MDGSVVEQLLGEAQRLVEEGRDDEALAPATAAAQLAPLAWADDRGEVAVGERGELFYRHVIAGQERAAALRAAQLAIRERRPNPFYWGAFICEGNPGPMQLSPPA